MLTCRFICLTCAYLIGGIIFMKYKNNANGIEMIPNINTWKEMPNYVKV